jgi:hypothetical protein
VSAVRCAGDPRKVAPAFGPGHRCAQAAGPAGVGQANLACAEPSCAQRTWTETSQAIAPRSALTRQARRWACEQVGRGEQTVAAARELGVARATVMRAVCDHGQPVVDDLARLEGVTGLRVDEHLWQHASARRVTQFATGTTDLTRAARTGWRGGPRPHRHGVRRLAGRPR